jgi:protein ImuA
VESPGGIPGGTGQDTEAVLAKLLNDEQLWRAGALDEAAPAAVRREPTGFAALDAALGGGWPVDGLTELLHGPRGIGELRLLLPALARLSRERHGWIAWIAPPHMPCADALAAAGVDVDRVLLVHTRTHEATLWAMEQALKSGTCTAVLGWPDSDRLRSRDLRRLQLAARSTGTWGVLARDRAAAAQASMAALRLALEPAPGERLVVELLKCRGAATRAPFTLDLPPVLASRMPVHERPGTAALLHRTERPRATAPQPSAETRTEPVAQPRRQAPEPPAAAPHHNSSSSSWTSARRAAAAPVAGAGGRHPLVRGGGYGARPSA